MGPHYAVCQFDPVATSTGARKHLNFIIHDHSLENDRTYGRTRVDEFAPSTSEPNAAKLTWDPAATGQQEGHEYAIKVSHRRTPSGQFFQTINPTLYQKDSPRSTYNPEASLTSKAYDVLHGTTHGPYVAPDADGGTGTSGSGTGPLSLNGGGGVGGSSGNFNGMGTTSFGQQSGTMSASGGGMSATGGVKPWTMPWQTGDRVVGGKMARAMHKGRTPTGAFANLDLAKANK